MAIYGKSAASKRISHRRQRTNLRELLRFMFEYIDKLMYYIGCRLERDWNNFFRVRRKKAAVRRAARIERVKGHASTTGFVISMAAGDIVNPFRKFFRSMHSLRLVMAETRGRGFRYRWGRFMRFWKYGCKWNRHLVVRFINYFAPLAAAAIFAVTVLTVLGMDFALSISYNNGLIGYVRNESVYSTAQKMISDRIIYSTDSAKDWSIDPVFKIAIVPSEQMSSEEAMANNILSVSGNEIVEASGLYIGGEFYGATTAITSLNDTVVGMLETDEENTVMKFTRDVSLVDGYYPTESIVSYDSLVELLTSDAAQDVYYTIREGDNLETIAYLNGTSTAKLLELNGEISDDTLAVGAQLLVASGEPLVQVQQFTTVTYDVEIPYETESIADARFGIGYKATLVPGETGLKQVTADVIVVDGVEVAREIIQEVVIKEPVNHQMLVGVSVPEGMDFQGSIIGTGTYCWPTVSAYVSRGYIAGYHLAIDIAGGFGDSVFAIDNGVVTTSTFHYSYGYYIVIDHGNGVQSLYAHAQALHVDVGDPVSKGDLIMEMGSTGNSTGPHVHVEIIVNGVRVDPAQYLY